MILVTHKDLVRLKRTFELKSVRSPKVFRRAGASRLGSERLDRAGDVRLLSQDESAKVGTPLRR